MEARERHEEIMAQLQV